MLVAMSQVRARRKVTSVPSGKTVSRCAATEILLPFAVARTIPVTLPMAFCRTSSSPACTILHLGERALLFLEGRAGYLC